MSHRVVCISRTSGAGGEQGGVLVAQRLGFRYVDDEVIALASERAGLPPSTVAKAEHHESLLTKLMDALVRAPMKIESGLPKRQGSTYYPPDAPPSVALPVEDLR